MFLKNNTLAMKQHGSALTMAVFMIVIFSLLGVVMLKLISTSSESLSYEVLGLRAYTAADSGLQWGLQQLFPLSSAVIECANVDFNNVPTLQVEGLNQCQIESLQCTDFEEAGTRYYTLTSTGTCSSAEVSTSRTLQIDARSL
ncbi:type II secretory pathway component [Thalassotalea fonticola]|uniref:Type II secretory pathway component n=1 Tax=Thalassotalea fonticola TaxID=3065649 RepID=A0ABZ0GJE0_9GAMM|nr:type II secretory pathway component [Colwelliaceae bacterium S1-1]